MPALNQTEFANDPEGAFGAAQTRRSGAVDIWLLPFEGLAEDALRRFCMALLSPDEAERAVRFALRGPQDQYIASRALVRLVLARCCSVPPQALTFTANEFGRPAISAPTQVQQTHFSLSHTDGLIALAVSSIAKVGLDVENVHRTSDITGIARSYFSPSEWSAIQHLEGQAQRDQFFSIWTLKEAYMKALGRGLSAGLESFSMTLTPQSAALTGGPPGAPDAHTWQFFRMQPTDRHRLAVAASFELDAPLVCHVHMIEDLRTLAMFAKHC